MSDGAIAIVGASCRFPGADGLELFWRLLASGADAVSQVGPDRWSTRFFYHPDRSEPGKSYTWSAGLIDQIDRFEPAFFGISPREAVQMDPQQRLLLELVWHAIEDAGVPARRLAGSTTGVYIGASATDYSDLRLGDPAGGDSYFMTGNTLSILANRISYIFDLRGPSLCIDTACSSSLVALHHACEALRRDQISAAIVGGVNLLLTPYPFLGFCRASMLSRQGRCYAFDERADGYVRAEGGGVIVLKPLAAALAAGDPIRAMILATGTNADGRTIGLSLPSETAQAGLLRSVYAQAGIAPDRLAFFEMHGTGTPAGDPVEAAAVGRALAQHRTEPLPIGSVKSNIGHLEPASGMAGVLKAMLALEQGVVPASLHCETPNPNIPFEALNLRLLRGPEKLTRAGDDRCAGVNSFGFGGTNAHVVLAPAPHRKEPVAVPGPLPPLLVSAATEASLRQLVEGWRNLLGETPAACAPALLRAAARGRDHHRHRVVALGGDPTATVSLLDEYLDGKSPPGLVTGTAVPEGRLAFVFSGNGAQFAGMGRKAMRASAVFRAAICRVDAVLRDELGWSVAELIDEGVDAAALRRTDIAQPLLFAIQVGIVDTLREAGVVAGAYIGHSVGEIAAAWGAGALSLAAAGRVVIERSRSQQRTQGAGKMAVLALSHDAAREFLAELASSAEIAALNATNSLTLSGSISEIERLSAEARKRNVWFRPLDLDFAFHSRQMEPIRETLLSSLAGLSSATPTARLVSSVSGGIIDEQPLDAEHWWRNIRNPVRFAEAVARLIGEGFRIFVEIGPGAILQSYLADGLRAAEVEGRLLATLSRNEADTDPFPAIAAQCYVAGHDFAQAGAFAGRRDTRSLPLYPWQRERFWFDRTVEAATQENPPFDHPLLGFRQNGSLPYWLNHLDDRVLPWIADHAVEGMAVFPAAAILETALAAARWRWPDAPGWEAFDVEVRRPLPFDKERMRELRTSLISEDGDWELASRARLSSEPMTVHAVGRISAACDLRPLLGWDHKAAAATCLDGDDLYRAARRAGLDYGPRFRTVEYVEIAAPDYAVVHLDPAAIGDPDELYLLHPALLDGALQGLLALLAERDRELSDISYLPWRFGRVRLVAPSGQPPTRAKLHLTRAGVRSVSADIALYDKTGAVVAELTDCWFRRVEIGRRSGADDRMFRIDLVPAPLGAPAPEPVPDASVIVFARLAGAWKPDPDRQEQAQLLDALIAAAARDAFCQLVEPAQVFTVGELVDTGRIADGSRALVTSLLRLLERVGAALEWAGEWRLDPAGDLPEAAEIWRLLLADAPELVAELALLAAALDELPKTLAAGPKPSAPSLTPMVEQLLTASPPSVAALDLLGSALCEIASGWSRGRPLRILEIGAIGGTTRQMLESVTGCEVALHYVATSADPEQLDRLALTMQSFVGASACLWSPQDGAEALGQTGFDVVLALSSCTLLQLDRASLGAVHQLLVPGGLLVAAEPEANAFWEVSFGQAAGWWIDDLPSGGVSPLRNRDDWQAELVAAGFVSTGTAGCSEAPWPCAVFWGSTSFGPAVAEASAVESREIALVGADTPLRCSLRASLAAAGHRVFAMASGDLSALADDNVAPGGPATILFPCAEPESCGSTAEQLVTLARLAHQAAEQRATLWVVTCGAQQTESVDAQADVALTGAALWAFARVLINELPRLKIRLIDLASAIASEDAAEAIAAELNADGPETEIVLTEHGRHVLRLRPGLPPRRAGRSDILSLASNRPGGFDALGWELGAPRTLGTGEVEIEVKAAGLNFRDMMWAMGLLPEEALIDGFAGPSFGLECAGIVRAIGSGVAGLAVGDRVAAFAPAALSTRVVTIADAVARIPLETGFAAAATLPVTFVTAIYALGHLAGLAPGEHVLIHSAAGGVGLAAIQYAKHRGAIVIATAGSEIKRAFLRLAGADHVLDSRDLGFADAVREITLGQGVDVVLNSLSGEAMERSLEIVKPFGRFLELGKRDFYLNRRVHLRPLRQNVSYFAIDIDQLPLRRPALARSLLAEVSQLLAERAIRPLAHRVFRFSEIDEAFRLMQSSGHIGKLVLVPDADRRLRLRQPRAFAARPDGTYLVTGGLTGFGLEMARWLVAHGAGAIALLGRRGLETPGCQAAIAELEAAGAMVRAYRADVADHASLEAALRQIRACQPPLRGVVHAASVIADRLAMDIDQAELAAMLRPKLGGAVALDVLTRDDPIELFVMFSSATTMLGAPGQGGYVAANATLEAVARRRRAHGRPALAIAWGPIEDAGYLAQRPEARDALARRLGAKPLSAALALAELPAILASGLPVVGFAETSWTEARRFLPVLATPLFAEIHAKLRPAADEALADRLAALDPEAAVALLRTVVAEEAARILRLPAGGVDPLRPLSQIGMDSLMAVELRLALESRLRVDLPLVSLAEGTSVASIAARLAEALKTGTKQAEVAALAARHEAHGATIAEEAAIDSKSAAAE